MIVSPVPSRRSPAEAPWIFDPLPIFGFDVIMADPPWAFELRSEAGEAKSAQAQYDCMRTEDICALPVNLLARRDTWLWLWGIFAMIDDARAVMDAWGFRFVTAGVWIKRGASGKLRMGPGYVLRGNAEPFLIGRIGNPRTFSRSIRNVIEAPAGRHSEKPALAYEIADVLFGPAFRADLFSRRTRPGWQAWGKEAGKFDDPAAVAPCVMPRSPLAPPAPVDVAQPGLFEELR